MEFRQSLWKEHAGDANDWKDPCSKDTKLFLDRTADQNLENYMNAKPTKSSIMPYFIKVDNEGNVIPQHIPDTNTTTQGERWIASYFSFKIST